MSKIDELQRLIALIDEKVKGWPKVPDWTAEIPFEERSAQWATYRAFGDRLLQELVKTEGAKTGSASFDGHALAMAGVRTSCTSGTEGLLRNWQTAARRRIAKLLVEEGAPA